MNLGMFPIAPMLLALIIPILYCLQWKKENLRKVALLLFCLILIVLLYPITIKLGYYIEPASGYFTGKLILFTILPLITIIYLERWKIKEALTELGVRKEKLGTSILFGLGVLAITLLLALIIVWGQKGTTSVYWNTVMFFEAFNEEFLFRGVLLLYLWKITDIKVAYATSIIAFVLAHPQHFTLMRIIGVVAQGILLALVTHKTKNIIGPWISHGLNRVIPQLLRAMLF